MYSCCNFIINNLIVKREDDMLTIYLFQAKTIKLDGLTNSELIGIIDTTLACIVSWLEGHSLAQTVFTNLYLHKPYILEDKILKAFCLSVYKLIDIIKDFIHK